MRSSSFGSARRPGRSSLFGAAVVGLAVVVAAGCSSDDGTAKAASKSSSATTAPVAASTQKDAGPAGAPGAAAAAGEPIATGGDPAHVGVQDPAIPLQVAVTGNTGLHDGDEVAVHVEPKDGSIVYGFEAIVCAGNAQFSVDADIRPTYTGKCITNPLSPSSQKYLAVKADPPFKVAEAKFKVGVGTNTYATRDGEPVAITCGPGSPCQLVLKLQYPNGFGFAAYPLTFG
jgi:hypothetical protein